MTVAELFVNLGMKGTTGVLKSLSGVQSELRKVEQLSFGAKAGIFAALVGLEEMTRMATNTAIDLKNFAGATGLSTEWLQTMGFVAEKNNVKLEELAGTIKGIQSAQAKMALGGSAPAGAMFFGLNPNEDPTVVFDKIRQKIQAVRNDQRQLGIAREMAATLGISDNMFAMFRVGDMSLQGFNKNMRLTVAEQTKLLKLNQEWNRFWMTLRGTSNKTVANTLAGPIHDLVGIMTNDILEISRLTKELIDTFNGINGDKLATTFKVIGAGLALMLAPIFPYTAALIALAAVLDDFHKYREGKDSYIGTALSAKPVQDFKSDWKDSKAKALGKWFVGGYNKEIEPEANTDPNEREHYRQALLRMVTLGMYNPDQAAAAGAGAGGPQINMNVEINEANDPFAVKSVLKDAVTEAINQNPASAHQ